MRRPKSRRSPERIATVWAPFVVGAGISASGDATWLVLANLLVGFAVAVAVASSSRTTRRLFGLLPRLGAAVLGANVAVLGTLFALERW